MFEGFDLKFKALADKQRLEILRQLMARDGTCVCDMCCIVDMPQSKLSYHLKILSDAGLIFKESRGTWNHYKVNNEELKKLLANDVYSLLSNKEDCGC